MIRRDPYWGVGEWVVVLIWKAATLAVVGITSYVAVDGGGGGWPARIFGMIYAPLAAFCFFFTQPNV